MVEQYLSDVSLGTPAPLGERKDRQGTGEIHFLEVSILDAKGRSIDAALTGQDIDIALSYRSRVDKPISRLDVHLTFYTTLGQFMFNCSSEGVGTPSKVLLRVERSSATYRNCRWPQGDMVSISSRQSEVRLPIGYNRQAI